MSFVIPVLNGARFIGGCLDRIRSEGRCTDEIIVVDNGSTDRTLEIARGAGVAALIEAPSVTIAALRNRGARVATHDVLAFIDADCLLEPGWRASVERVLADRAVAATGSFYDIPADATWIERAWWSFRPRHEHRTGFLISGNLVIRRAAFDAVGGFNERLVTDEDSDICDRLISSGAALVEAPLIRVVHLGNAKTLGQFYAKERWHATSSVAATRARRLDGPTVLTFVFMAAWVLAAAVVLLGGRSFAVCIAVPALILAAPVATAAYRVLRYHNYRYLLQLIPLYLIVYVVRAGVLIRALLKRPTQL